jgi:preprotein translocase subunit SecG
MPGLSASSLVVPTLAFVWPSWLIGIIITLFLFVCVVMVLTVLIQKPQGGGLASAFGGGASAGQTAFGTKTGDALTVVTIAVFVAYLLLAVVLNYAARPQVADASTSAEGVPASTEQAPADQAPADQAPADQAPADQAPAQTPAIDPTTNTDNKQPGAATPGDAVPAGNATPAAAPTVPPVTPPAGDPAAAPK